MTNPSEVIVRGFLAFLDERITRPDTPEEFRRHLTAIRPLLEAQLLADPVGGAERIIESFLAVMDARQRGIGRG